MSAGAYLVKGTDPSLRDRVVDDLVAELLGDDDRSLALEEIVIPGRAGPGEESDATAGAEGREAAVAALLNAAGSPPFMTAHRVVVARDVGALTAGDVDGIVRYLENPLDTTILVFVSGGGTIPAALSKQLKAVKAQERAPESEKTDKVLIGSAHEAGLLLVAGRGDVDLVAPRRGRGPRRRAGRRARGGVRARRASRCRRGDAVSR